MFYKTCAFMLPDNIFAYVVMRCLSVCLPVTFVSCVKTNKRIVKFFLPSGSRAILVFPCQTA